MVLKVKYKLLTPGCAPVINANGDAFDLVAAKDVTLETPRLRGISAEDGSKIKAGFHSTIIPLGIAMELPKGWVADVRPRSSTYKKWHIILANSFGLIDSTYCGDTDEWGYPAIALSTSHIKKGDRICQFEIRPSQKASIWQKLRWLLTSKIEFVQVETLGNKARGGFGEGTKNVEGGK